MVKPAAADAIRADIADAVEKGAKALIDPSHFSSDKPGSAYLAPQILVDVNHTMRVMIEESFGPVCGIMKVKSDEEAIRWMNDSQYGLTAAIWTQDQEAAVRIGNELETGTVFQNRCDYVDPGLAWTGVKNTGVGCTLSSYGFLQLTRPKSFHLKTIPSSQTP
jgi:acyl-CoA reductase-like NAD-dependent aldehyde dehydrogenase